MTLASSRRDDMESLFYTLIFLYRGDLPWSLYEKLTFNDILTKKKEISHEELCRDLPENFNYLYCYIWGLDHASEPNYEMIIGLLRGCMENEVSSPLSPYKRAA